MDNLNMEFLSLLQKAASLFGETQTDMNSLAEEGGWKEFVWQQKAMIPRMDMSFEEYATALLNRGIKKAGPRTKEGYRTSLVPVLEHIGSMNIADIDRDRLMAMFTDLSFKYAQASLNKSFIITKIIFEEAFESGYLYKNPFLKLEKPKSQKMPGEKREHYSDQEIDLILKKAKEYPNPMVYTMLAVLESTGMRPGEMRVLMWKDLDMEAQTVHIHQAAKKGFDKIDDIRKTPKFFEYIGPTKTLYGNRTLKLSPVAAAALKEWRKQLDTMSDSMKESKYIFPNRYGEFSSESAFSCLMKRFVKKAGIEDMGFMPYRFRHTMCTRLVLMKYPDVIIQRIMGDNTLEVIAKVYTHVTDQNALDFSDRYFTQQQERYDHLLRG